MDAPLHEDSPYALVVDDDWLIRMDAMGILEDAGFRTFEAADPEAALAILIEHHAKIVLLFTDVEMPGPRNGFALACETASLWPHISMVVASGHVRPGPDDLPEGARFLGKPFSAKMVHDHLHEILPDGRKPEPLRRRQQQERAPI